MEEPVPGVRPAGGAGAGGGSAAVCGHLGRAPLHLLDVLGALLVLAARCVESTADAQLVAFRANAANRGRVLDSGLWRYSRHPNYFGEFCVWWGFFLWRLSTGAWWTLFSPLLMSVLLLRVSGVTLLEKDMGERRPATPTMWRAPTHSSPAHASRSPLAQEAHHDSSAPWRRTPPGPCGAGRLPGREPSTAHGDKVDLPRFMGDWYVIANIPTFMRTRRAQRRRKSMRSTRTAASPPPSPFVTAPSTASASNTTRAVLSWIARAMPCGACASSGRIKADYRITYVSDDYSQTVISRQKRDYVWIMARTPQIPPADYDSAAGPGGAAGLRRFEGPARAAAVAGMKIAIIGSGIAGNVAARRLHRDTRSRCTRPATTSVATRTPIRWTCGRAPGGGHRFHRLQRPHLSATSWRCWTNWAWPRRNAR